MLGGAMSPLRRLRLMRGLTQQELGEKAGTTGQAISEIESRRRIARPAIMRKVADALGVEIEAIDEFARPAIDPGAEA